MTKTTTDNSAAIADIAPNTQAMRLIVAASAAGTTFEWYDFFVFASLSAVIAKVFFVGVSDAAAFIFALAAFGAGFAVRPIGAIVFGVVGDRIGRKAAFVITVTIMGVATVGLGLLPTYKQAGIVAPILLIALRMIQGFAVGGEYGGAVIYVAEHAPADKRGRYTGWIQISATLGVLAALSVVLITRKIVGEADFGVWGWRIPFLISAALLAISLFMRARLAESPTFRRMQAEGGGSKAPLSEAFLKWRHLKVSLVALFSMLIAQGAVWYLAFFYAQFFLEKVLKIESASCNLVMMAVTLVTAPLYIFFGALSDKVGRKPVMLFGMILGLVAIFPCFQLATLAGNPALAHATHDTPVTVIADPADCAVQFDPIGKAAFLSSCDIAKSLLTSAGISYRNQAAPSGSAAVVQVGPVMVASASAKGLPPAAAKAVKADVEKRVMGAVKAAGYPASADPKAINWPLLFLALVIVAVGAVAIYGPLGACMVELYPTRIRYTAISLPYNIGIGWVGGFLSAISFAMVAVQGNMFFGLWYSVGITALAIVVTVLFLPETRGRDLGGEH